MRRSLLLVLYNAGPLTGAPVVGVGRLWVQGEDRDLFCSIVLYECSVQYGEGIRPTLTVTPLYQDS